MHTPCKPPTSTVSIRPRPRAILRFLLSSIIFYAPLCTCERNEDQQRQERPDHQSGHAQFHSRKPIPEPIYFSQLPQERIDEEVAYAELHMKWSQRVVLEIFHDGILGRAVVAKQAEGDGDILTFRHPTTGNDERYRKGFKPNWDAVEYNGVQTICDHWEGITCHERNDNKLADVCWCIMKWEADEYQWAVDSDILPDQCGNKCQEHGMIGKNQAPLDAITRIDLKNYGLFGSMIPEELSHLKFLERIDLGGNRLIGSFPKTLGDLPGLKYVNLANCDVLEFPQDMAHLYSLQEMILSDAFLSGPIPKEIFQWPQLIHLDLSHNLLTGALPPELFKMRNMLKLTLDNNQFTGSIPSKIGKMKSLRYLSLGKNKLTGTIPKEITKIPYFEFLRLNDNRITGEIHPELFTNYFLSLEVENNEMTGSIPKELNESTKLQVINLAGNKIQGYITDELCDRVRPRSRFSENVVAPCSHLVVCPRSFFHVLGYASETEPCRPCPSCFFNDLKDKSCAYVGQTTCHDGSTIVRGDMNGDGRLNAREILRLLYIFNEGYDWDEKYHIWGDVRHDDECTLPGVECKNGLMGIYLKPAKMCSSGRPACGRIPSEIGLLADRLDILDMGSIIDIRTRMRIPTEIGQLKKLRVLDVSNNILNHALNSEHILPSEIAKCQELNYLNLYNTGLTEPLGDEIWSLEKLQKLDIRENNFPPQPLEIKKLTYLQELLASRCNFVGTIPNEIGNLRGLINIELWGNSLVGTLPQSMDQLKFLTRIDLYNNHLTGSIEPLANLPSIEIIHLKKNAFSGTIPEALGEISRKLSWLDLSSNNFIGLIPSNLGYIPNLTDLQLGDNKLFSSIPESLCSSGRVNGGQIGKSCDHIICPLGTFSELGFAKAGGKGCTPCPAGENTMFLGQTSCYKPPIHEHVELFFSTVYDLGWIRSDQDEIIFDGEDSCAWEGVVCDQNTGEIKSIEFSLSKLKYDEDLFSEDHGL